VKSKAPEKSGAFDFLGADQKISELGRSNGYLLFFTTEPEE
jgi:hypothetical protein